MYPLHLAGALSRAEEPREARNRNHLLAMREAHDADRQAIEPFRPSTLIPRIAFAGGSTSLSADFGAACCA